MKSIKVFNHTSSHSIQTPFTKDLVCTINIHYNTTFEKLYDKIAHIMGRIKYINGHYDHSGFLVYLSIKIIDSSGGISYDFNPYKSFSCHADCDNLYDLINDVIFITFGTYSCTHMTTYENNACVICLRERVSGDKLVVNKACGHELFCRECAEQTSHSIKKCPICNVRITTLDIPDCAYSQCYKCNKFVHDPNCVLIGKLPWQKQIFKEN